ncbi:MAG: glycerophosphodiester phosphodiesterase family protein [Bacteroidia bacterium]
MKWVLASVIALVLISSCEKETPSAEPEIIGHRGNPAAYPENTAESFNSLLSGGIFRLETDVLLTKGDTLILFHDAEVSRLTNLTGLLTDYTPTQIKAGIKTKSGGTGLTLNEFLDQYEFQFHQIFIDLKEGQGDAVYKLADILIGTIRKHKLEHKVVITSTSEIVLEYIQNKDNEIQLATDYGSDGMKSAISHHFPYCLLPIHQMSSSIYSLAQSTGVKVIAYTTTNIIECERAIVYGCDGVITDVPLEMKVLYE